MKLMQCSTVGADVSGTPKHVTAEDIELFRQACNITRQVVVRMFTFAASNSDTKSVAWQWFVLPWFLLLKIWTS